MTVVGNASVVVRALTTQFTQDLRKSFSQAEGDADRAGASFGGRFSRAASRGVDPNEFFRRIVSHIDGAGDEAGSSFWSSFMRRGRQLASDGGSSLGNLFSVSFGAPDIGGRLAVKILALVPLIGVLGGALAALVGALTAVAGAAAFAAGSLAAIATGVAGLIGVIAVAALAFSGVGKAVSALGQEQANAAKEAVALGRQQEAAAKRVEQAQRSLAQAIKNLQRAREAAADSAEAAARRVEDAEERLADAQKDAKRAQEGLNEAREDAVERLEDLQLSLRGAVLGEEQAALNLAKAQEELIRVLNDPTASEVDREQARLDFQRAELALDEAADRREDLTKETEEANQKGVEGADNVVAAKERVTDANEAIKDSEQDLADAREDQADAAVDAAERIADAQQGIKDAQDALAEATRAAADANNALAASTDAVNKAMKDLSPEAQKFARFLFSLKPEIDKLKEAAGAELFAPLTQAIRTVVASFFPTLQSALRTTGGALGGFAKSFADAFTNKDFQSNVLALADTFKTSFPSIGRIFGNLVRAFTGLALAAAPVFQRFLNFVDRITGSFAKKFEGEENLKSMTDLIGRMGDAAALFGETFGNLFKVIKNVFSAGLGTGLGLTKDMSNTFAELAENTKKGTPGYDRIQKFFENIKEPTKAVLRFAGALGKEFLKLGENGKLSEIFAKLTDVVPKLGKAIQTFTTDVAPTLVKVIGNIIDIFQRVVDSGLFKAFAATLSFVTSAVKALLGVLAATGLDKVIGPILGIAFGLKFLSGISGVAVKLIGGLRPILTFLGGKVLKIAALGLRAVGIAMRFALGPVGLAITAIALLVAGFIYAYKHSEKFRKIVDGAMKGVKKAFEVVKDVVGRVFGFIKKHFDIILFALGPLGIAIGTIVQVFKNWDKIKAIIAGVVGAVVDFFKNLPGRIASFAADFGAKIFLFADKVRTGLKDKISGFITNIVDFFRNLPGRVVAFAVSWALKLDAFADKVRINLKNKISSLIGDVVGFFRDLPGRLLGFVTSIGSAAGKLGSAIFDGIKKGVSGALGAVGSLGTAVLNGLIDIINNFAIKPINNAIPNDLKIKGIGIDLPDNPIPTIPKLAAGATILPRRGGTLALLAEAGRSESVVDTGLINRRLREGEVGTENIVAELRRVQALLEQIKAMGGITIDAPITQVFEEKESAARETSRKLRTMAFELGA